MNNISLSIKITVRLSVGAIIISNLISCADEPKKPASDTRTVYVCKSPAAYSYHFIQDCPGLQKCTHTVEKTNIITAQKQGRKFCGWEINKPATDK